MVCYIIRGTFPGAKLGFGFAALAHIKRSAEDSYVIGVIAALMRYCTYGVSLGWNAASWSEFLGFKAQTIVYCHNYSAILFLSLIFSSSKVRLRVVADLKSRLDRISLRPQHISPRTRATLLVV